MGIEFVYLVWEVDVLLLNYIGMVVLKGQYLELFYYFQVV